MDWSEQPEIVRVFETRNYKLVYEVIPEQDLDLGDMNPRRIQRLLDCGVLVGFSAHVKVIHKGTGLTLGADSLGNCIYESAKEFIKGGYFLDMVETAIAEARAAKLKLCAA